MGPLLPSLLVSLVLSLSAGVAGCGAPSTAADPTPPPVGTAAATAGPTAPAASPAVSPPGADPSPSAEPSSGATVAPTAHPAAVALAGRPWATATLTEVSTGRAFTIAEFAGRTVFVEAMAIWCTKCREQQLRFKEALGRLDASKVAYVVLTVDPGETAAELARYKRDRGFLGEYAVAGKDVSTALAKEFGSTVLNPPTVPLILVTTTGEIRFKTGGESVDEIVRLVGA